MVGVVMMGGEYDPGKQTVSFVCGCLMENVDRFSRGVYVCVCVKEGTYFV